MRATIAGLALLFGFASPPVSADEIKTRVPQENFDAFVNSCRGSNIPAATCQCMALKMIRLGQDGEITLDSMGLQSRKIQDEAARRAALVALLDRYHVTGSQAQAAVGRTKAGFTELAQSCS